MASKELNFSKSGLDGLKANLQAAQNQMKASNQMLLKTEKKLASSLKGETQSAYQERAKKINQEFEKSMEAFSVLIQQIEQSNQTAFEVDRKIGKQMLK